MSIIFSAPQKYRVSPKVFLFVLSISIFVLSATALAEIQQTSQSENTGQPTGSPEQASQTDTVSADTSGVEGQTDTVSADTPVAAAQADTVSADTTDAEGQTAEVEAHSEEINHKRGERFFKGLLPHRSKQPSCVSCHNLVPLDTLNWNPSAMDIADKYIEQDFDAFQEVVMQPAGRKMAQVHQGYQFEEADLQSMKLYLDDLSMRGPIAAKPNINRLLLFIFLSLIVVLALLELIVFRKIKYKAISLVIFLGVFGYQVAMIYEEGVRLGRSPDYEPAQPIKFSHKVHAGQNQIDCKYCHFTSEQSKSAGIPPADLCLNCHNLVREGTRSGQFEIAKVIEANEKQIPIEWIRVHDLPDHVFFSHAQHVNAGKLDCKECHGDVAEMDVIRQVEDLSMGWCLDCHKTKEVQFANNNFYESYEKLHEQIKDGQINKVTVDMIGGTNCMKCHY
jgi:hypothetical protein